tara:strand:- start:171 stop:989 length:819 start_codon:yes stop_codon:yes gene_type:complete
MKIIADVGGTRGRWVLVDEKIIKTVETNGFNPYSYNISSLEKIIISLKSSFIDYRVNKITYYGAGINNKETIYLVEGLLKNHFKNIQINVFSDLLGSCRALCKNKKGIVSILGTGSNSCYYDGKEINMQINSLGYLLGDEGSGYALGRSFLKKYLRKELNGKLSKDFEDIYQIRHDNYKILYEKNSNRLISKLADFINENKNDEILNELIFDHFNYYFKEIICKYNSKKLYLSGSIAYFFEDEIKKVAGSFNINIIKIIKDPINHLVEYHVK